MNDPFGPDDAPAPAAPDELGHPEDPFAAPNPAAPDEQAPPAPEAPELKVGTLVYHPDHGAGVVVRAVDLGAGVVATYTKQDGSKGEVSADHRNAARVAWFPQVSDPIATNELRVL